LHYGERPVERAGRCANVNDILSHLPHAILANGSQQLVTSDDNPKNAPSELAEALNSRAVFPKVLTYGR
jgi:hypothetical protein